MSGVVIQTQKVRIVRLQLHKRQSLELRGTHTDRVSLPVEEGTQQHGRQSS